MDAEGDEIPAAGRIKRIKHGRAITMVDEPRNNTRLMENVRTTGRLADHFPFAPPFQTNQTTRSRRHTGYATATPLFYVEYRFFIVISNRATFRSVLAAFAQAGITGLHDLWALMAKRGERADVQQGGNICAFLFHSKIKKLSPLNCFVKFGSLSSSKTNITYL
eukprot:scaffold41566_cov176-Amphora_coffeaeformis.AAC.2